VSPAAEWTGKASIKTAAEDADGPESGMSAL
jgi:hypothetical protein